MKKLFSFLFGFSLMMALSFSVSNLAFADNVDVEIADLPATITAYVEANYSSSTIVEASMDDEGYDVKLDDDGTEVELQFDLEGNFVAVDDDDMDDDSDDSDMDDDSDSDMDDDDDSDMDDDTDMDDDSDDSDTDEEFECPDVVGDLEFHGFRAYLMERLREKNPDRYEEIVGRLQHHRERFFEACIQRPEFFQRLMQKRAEALQKVENRFAEKLERFEGRILKVEEKIVRKFRRLENNIDRLGARLRRELERRLENSGRDMVEICHHTDSGEALTLKVAESAWPAHEEHGDTMGECNDGSDDSDTNDDDDDDDDIDDNDTTDDGRDDDSDDDMTDDEVEGTVASVDIEESIVVLDDETEVEVTSDTVIDQDGDVLSLEDVADMLDDDVIVRVEADGSYVGNVFVADNITFETDN